MSWTTDLDTARWFADRWLDHGYQEAEVVTVLAPPEAMLVETADDREHEVVVDPTLLPRVRRFEGRRARNSRKARLGASDPDLSGLPTTSNLTHDQDEDRG